MKSVSLKKTMLAWFNRSSKNENKPTALPVLYAGTWTFIDEVSHKHHQLEITLGLRILIDGRELPGTIEQLNNRQLVFLDKYGYQLKINADYTRPVSLFDEADDRTYTIIDPTIQNSEQPNEEINHS